MFLILVRFWLWGDVFSCDCIVVRCICVIFMPECMWLRYVYMICILDFDWDDEKRKKRRKMIEKKERKRGWTRDVGGKLEISTEIYPLVSVVWPSTKGKSISIDCTIGTEGGLGPSNKGIFPSSERDRYLESKHVEPHRVWLAGCISLEPGYHKSTASLSLARPTILVSVW